MTEDSIERLTRLVKLKSELIDDINNLSYDSYIDLKFENIKDVYSIQNYIRSNSDCFNKEIGIVLDRKKNEVRILPYKLRKREKKKEVTKKEICIGRLLSEVI